jgi:phosphoglycolate phosphatase-like HAD superfamily hydrolase
VSTPRPARSPAAKGGGEGRLLLFDVDGTLLVGGADAHREAVYEALREVHGIPDPAAAPVQTPGRTDSELVRMIALHNGLSAQRIDERMDEVRAAACAAYARLVPDDLSHAVAPGVAELLDDLGRREGVLLALLTGNYEPIARLKLARAGIGRRFARGQGAFGSDAEDRTDLPAIARTRAGRDGPGGRAPHPRERTVVIGDTPRDIACARADGVRCLAVASGPFAAADLRAADAVAHDARGLLAPLEALL